MPNTVNLIGAAGYCPENLWWCHGGALVALKHLRNRGEKGWELEPRFETTSTPLYCRGFDYWVALTTVDFLFA